MSTLIELVEKISLKVGDETVGEYYAENEIKNVIGESYRFYARRLKMRGEGYFETTANLSTVANQEYIDLTTLDPKLWTISTIYRVWGTTKYPLKKAENRYIQTSTTGGSGSSYLPTYRFRSNRIILSPPPSATEADAFFLEYVYIPEFPDLNSDEDFEFDANFPDIYEDNIILRSCVKLLESKDAVGGISDIATFRNELTEIDKDFDESINKDEVPDYIIWASENEDY